MAPKIGQKVKLVGGDTGTIQDIHAQSNSVQVRVNGQSHWMRQSMIAGSRKPRCHYCGMPASHHNFFGAWVCRDCS